MIASICSISMSRKYVDFQTWRFLGLPMQKMMNSKFGILCGLYLEYVLHVKYECTECVCVRACVREGRCVYVRAYMPACVQTCVCHLLLTLFFSISLVSMTMTGAWCSHTICQKSSSVSGVGPGGGACRRGHSTPDCVHAALCPRAHLVWQCSHWPGCRPVAV